MEEITTPEPATEADQVAEATNPESAGEGADGSDNSVSLDALSEVLGKDFKDADGALKSIKDTYNYVGSQAQFKEQVSELATALNTDEAGVLSTLNQLATNMNQPNEPAAEENQPAEQEDRNFVTREEMDEQNFFNKNENLADLKDVLTPLKEAHGQDMSWDEFAQTEAAQKVIEPITGYREMEQQKSALESNSRLGAVSDTMTKANESLNAAKQAAQSGDTTAANQAENSARESAVAGVIEAFDLK